MGCPWSCGWRCLGRPAAGIARECQRTWRRCRQVVIETPEFTRSDRPAAAGDDHHRAPPRTAGEFHRSRRLASRGWPWSRAWQCFGRPAAGIASECQRLNLAPLPASGDQDARICPSCAAGSGDDRPRAPPGTAVEFHRSRRLASRVARGRVLGGALAGGLPGSRASASGGTRRRCRRVAIKTPGLPVLACLAVPWPAGCRDRERLPAEPGAAAGSWRSGRPGLPDLTGWRR